MRGSRRLSLQARLLSLLIGITTILLLIMGIVSIVVEEHSAASQFDSGLISESADTPEQIRTDPHGYAAARIVSGPRPDQIRVVALTGTTGATSALTASITALGRRHLLASYLCDLASRPRLRRSCRLSRNPVFSPPPALGIQLRACARWIPAARAGGPAVLVVARPAAAATRAIGGIIVVELITGGALVALAAIAGSWLIGRGLDPLRQMASTARDITTRGDLTARMPDADDQTEAGQLGAAINVMLDRIHQAFGARVRSEQKVREFAADASHELRTPLTTIRGYAELYRQGALGPGELPDAMRRIESEADRMSVLVSELLELARLDRSSSLDLAETDLARVVRDAVADAVAVEPDRPVQAETPDRLVAVVDQHRIRQVLANLLANVRAHTPAGTPVRVSLRPADGGLWLEVADAGPGMSATDAARAFDRFHRGTGDPGSSDPGVIRAGSGLGLAIVAAIASAHGGHAALRSDPGQGTAVSLWLPAPGGGG